MILKLCVVLCPSEGKGKVLLLSSLQVAQSGSIEQEECSLLFNRPDFNKHDRPLE